MKYHIYADNASTTKLDIDAFEAMKEYLINDYSNPSQPYSFACFAKKALNESRDIIAQSINADRDEIIFTSGGTESDNFAIKGVAFSSYEKKAIITSCIEHHAVLNACVSLEKMGYPVAYLPVSSQGEVKPESLEEYITNNTKLVSVMFSNNEIGTIQNVKELAKIAHSHGALFHSDAVQAIGHIPIDVKELNVDLLSASAHKFNGPKGVGFLYVKRGTNIVPLNNGGKQEFGLRSGTENVASIVGMALALKKNCMSLNNTRLRLEEIEKCFIETLNYSEIDFIRNGSSNHILGNISISFKGISGEALLHRLDLTGIYISTGSACDSVNTQISHVIKSIGVPEEYKEGTVRISFGRDNTVEEARIVAKTIVSIINSIRNKI